MAARVPPGNTSVDEYTELYRTYVGQIHAYIRRKFPDLDTDDIAQDTMERLWRIRDQLRRDGGNVRALIFTIADHAATDVCRSRARERQAPLYLLSPTAAATPADTIETMTDRDLLARSLDRLPHAEQQLLRMRFWHGLSHRSLADHMGVSVVAMRTRMSRATRQCGAAFAKLTAAMAALAFVHKVAGLVGRKVALTTAAASTVTAAAVVTAGFGYLAPTADDDGRPSSRTVTANMATFPDAEREKRAALELSRPHGGATTGTRQSSTAAAHGNRPQSFATGSAHRPGGRPRRGRPRPQQRGAARAPRHQGRHPGRRSRGRRGELDHRTVNRVPSDTGVRPLEHRRLTWQEPPPLEAYLPPRRLRGLLA